MISLGRAHKWNLTPALFSQKKELEQFPMLLILTFHHFFLFFFFNIKYIAVLLVSVNRKQNIQCSLCDNQL